MAAKKKDLAGRFLRNLNLEAETTAEATTQNTTQPQSAKIPSSAPAIESEPKNKSNLIANIETENISVEDYNINAKLAETTTVNLLLKDAANKQKKAIEKKYMETFSKGGRKKIYDKGDVKKIFVVIPQVLYDMLKAKGISHSHFLISAMEEKMEKENMLPDGYQKM